jgi:thiol-disulfide isomerase/thioredoxin
MKNWIIVLLIFVIPLGLYGYLDCRAKENTEIIAQNLSLLENNSSSTGNQTKISKTATLYKFSSPMCGDCKKLSKEMGPIVTKWRAKVTFKDINVSGSEGESKEVQDMITKYNIKTVPALVYIDKNGKFVKKTEGYVLNSEIDGTLKNILGE